MHPRTGRQWRPPSLFPLILGPKSFRLLPVSSAAADDWQGLENADKSEILMNMLQQYCDIWDETRVTRRSGESAETSSWFNYSKHTSAKIRGKAQVSLHTHTQLWAR